MSNLNKYIPKENYSLVVGNGFDCFCGLETKYINFFNSKKNIYKSIDEWKKRFSLNERLYVFETDSRYNSFFPENILDSSITFWDLCFYFAINEHDKNWCDIELEMRNILIDNKDNNNSIYINDIKNYIRKLNTTKPDNYNSLLLAAYLKHKYLDINNDNFYKYVLDELINFERDFAQFVIKEYKDKYDLYKAKAHDFFNQIIGKEKNIVDKFTFNYTDVSIVKDSNLFLSNFKHVNGDYTNLIFGIDSEDINPLSPEFAFTKVSRKMRNSIKQGINFNALINKNINNLIIFGHSLNPQDYNFFFSLFNASEISNKESTSKIIFAYCVYEESKRETIENNFQNSIEKIIYEYGKYVKNSRLLEDLWNNGKIEFHEVLM